MLNKTLGEMISSLRKEKNMTQNDLAKKWMLQTKQCQNRKEIANIQEEYEEPRGAKIIQFPKAVNDYNR